VLPVGVSLRPLPAALAQIESLPAPLRTLHVTLFQRAILEPILGLDTHGRSTPAPWSSPHFLIR
jgi:hypothetical protein